MAQSHIVSLFNFAGITASLVFSDFEGCNGFIEGRGFDAGGEYAFANIMTFCTEFRSPKERDAGIARAMTFVAAEMRKQAAWQAA